MHWFHKKSAAVCKS